MDEARRIELVNKRCYTFQGGLAAYVGGWANPAYATVATDNGGFYHVLWERIERAAESDGVIRAAWLASEAWLGCKAEQGRKDEGKTPRYFS